MAFSLIDGNEVEVTVMGLDKDGNTAELDLSAPATISVDVGPELVSVGPGSTNGSILVKTAEGPGVGLVSILIGGDADLGEGVTPLSVRWDAEVISGEASTLTAVAGEQTPRGGTATAPTPTREEHPVSSGDPTNPLDRADNGAVRNPTIR